jgi:hypothetical protein
MRIVAEVEIFDGDERSAREIVWKALRHIERLKIGKIIFIRAANKK